MLVDGVPVTPAPERPFIVFPPFPQPPPGAKVPVWSEFKPAGIRVVLDPDSGEIERDGRGTPTVPLASSHSLTPAERMKHKTNKKLKRSVVDAKGNLKPAKWYEEWEQIENNRRISIDPAVNRIDRLDKAADEFKEGRPWPPSFTDSNPLVIWEWWRQYIGLQTESRKTKKPKVFNEEEEDDDGDDVEGEGEDNTPQSQFTVKVGDSRQTQTEHQPQPQPEEPDEEALARRARLQELKEIKKAEFLDNPEMTVRIFFSGHWRDKGYAHSKQKCEEGPILIGFFLRYLIRNRIFPEEEVGLKRAFDLCEKAKAELPGTFNVGHALPDAVSASFEALNGEMGNRSKTIVVDVGGSQNGESESEADTSDQPDAKKRKVEADAPEEAREESAAAAIDPNAIDHDSIALQDAVQDNVDINGEEVQDSAEGENSWAGAWDTGIEESTTGWGRSVDAVDASSAWAVPKESRLFELLGPSMLPYTHTTGVVERSVRKIEKIIRPQPVPAKKRRNLTPAEAVEEELAQRLGVVVFTPWVRVGNHVASDIVAPEILPDSRGRVVVPVLTAAERMNYGLLNGPPPPPPPNDADSPYPAFDPRRDAVQVLVDPDTLDKLAPYVGMGVLATFVQITRKTEPGDDVDVRPEWWDQKWHNRDANQRGAPGKNGEPTPWWYMESLMFVLTSFHADKYFAEQDKEPDTA